MDNKKVFCIVSGILIACSIIFMTKFIHIPYVWDVVALSIIAVLLLTIYKLWVLAEMYRESAFTDPLSGIYNRRGGENALMLQLNTISRERRIKRDKKGIDICVVSIDIDNFKTINDIFGHSWGDATIKAICQFIKKEFTRSTDICIRQGGDELSIILLDTSVEVAQEKVSKICQSLTEPTKYAILFDTKTLKKHVVTLSIGIAASECSLNKDSWPSEIHNLKERADEAVYLSKRGGRNRTTTIRGLPQHDSRSNIETAINKTALIGE